MVNQRSNPHLVHRELQLSRQIRISGGQTLVLFDAQITLDNRRNKNWTKR